MSDPANALIVLVGLPGSGKSTWAKENRTFYNAPIVSADAVRLAIHGQRFVPSAEPFVHATVHAMVRALFLAGHGNVIVDECNVSRKRRDAFQSKKWRTLFHEITTPAAECIARAEANEDPVIIPVIHRMAAEYEPLGEGEIRFAEGIDLED